MAILGSGAGPALRAKFTETVSALVERICVSPEFDKSPRSQELLRYLCERTQATPSAHITEYEIGVALFGWDRDLPPESDTIVRVQVSQLRKRLAHYFLDSGRDESVEILIPRGSYAPVVQFRDAPAIELAPLPQLPQELAPAEEPAPAPQKRFHLKTALASASITALVVLGLGFWYAQATHRLGDRTAATSRPALDHFWAGFRQGSPAMIVLPDVSHRLLSEFEGETIPLSRYKDGFPNAIIDAIKPPRERLLADRITDTQITGMHDAVTLSALGIMFASYNVPFTPILARDFRVPQRDNLVLLGHLKGNPWLELFQHRLNFRYAFDWETRRGAIVNSHPQPGEQPAYTVDYNRSGYCVVACLPKTADQSEIVLIFGSDVASLEAGGRFATSEPDLEGLYRHMGKTIGNAPRHVEVLLRTRLMGNLAPEHSVLVYRVYPQ